MANLTLKPINDSAGWVGTDIHDSSDWKHILSDSEVSDLLKMADVVQPALRSDPNNLLTLPREYFDTGVFSQRLEAIYRDLKSGLGLALIRGLPVNDMSTLDIAIVYWGIGLHLGTATPNNPDGDMFGHITDLGKTQKDANSRGYQTREAMDYHCDQADMVGLLCLRSAKSGGLSKVASSIAMYNQLLEEQPELVTSLCEPLHWSKMGEYEPGESPFYKSPVFNFLENKLCVSFGPTHIEKGHALEQVPDLTDTQRKAITTAEDIADENRLEMELQVGDMQFLNNYVCLHTRSAYIDHDEDSNKRLLWRLWLMNSDLRPRTGYTKNFLNGINSANKKPQIRL